MWIRYDIEQEDIAAIKKKHTRYKWNIGEFSLLYGALRIICQENPIDAGMPDQSK